ncbi:hypothetical protein L1049_011281 [Liquidambar formosana]|uniref:Uncharacterized protein n=1 Tax=Liquidambar formosana TaxID=63359 RepID=A0AAP0RR83_LIQFO
MGAKENHQEPIDYNTDSQDLDESLEILSLCDLPIYNDAAEWDDFSKEDQSSTEDQDFFEFFSEDFAASTCRAENIVFCGKLITYKEPISEKTQKKRGLLFRWKSKSFNFPKGEAHPKKRFSFRWKSASFNKSKSSRTDGVSNSKSPASPAPDKDRYMTGKHVDEHDISFRKVSRVNSSVKPRWNLFMIGLMRVPTEMELSDMKNRQRRRIRSTTSFRSFNGGQGVRVRKSRGKRFWRLLKALRWWRSHHANAVVKTSFGCIPRV